MNSNEKALVGKREIEVMHFLEDATLEKSVSVSEQYSLGNERCDGKCVGE